MPYWLNYTSHGKVKDQQFTISAQKFKSRNFDMKQGQDINSSFTELVISLHLAGSMIKILKHSFECC